MARPLRDGKKHNERMSFAFTMDLKNSLKILTILEDRNLNRLVENILQNYVNERKTDIENFNAYMEKKINLNLKLN